MQRVLGLTRESQIFLPPSPPSAGFRGCEGGSGERKIEKVQSAQALHFASEFRHRAVREFEDSVKREELIPPGAPLDFVPKKN
jgi:arylsulfatase